LRSVDNGMSHAGAFVASSRVSCKGEIGDQNFRVSALPPNLGQRMTAMGVRRDKAALSSGCNPHPAIRSCRKQSEQHNTIAEFAG
jgi:hypothetical protein